MKMKTLWLTYSWKDDQAQIDFVIQELERKGVSVRRDKWVLQAGKRLWSQIANEISDPSKTDGWAIFMTSNSLNSEPCKEELFYALDEAIRVRGESYPLIGISDGMIDESVIPKPVATRLYVNLKDSQWAERIAAAFF